jgi:hypothetical protein
VATEFGEPGSKIRFVELTSNGKDEYLVQYDGGSAKAFRYTGKIPDAGKSTNWVELGTISNGVSPQGPVAYSDLNAD